MVTKKKLTKEEWEAMTGTDMSLILPSDGSIETARESSLNDIGKEKSEGTVEQTDTTSENLQPSTGKEEAVPTSQRRISSRQRKLSLDEYRKAFVEIEARYSASKTASPCLLAARYVTGWTSLSAGWEDAR